MKATAGRGLDSQLPPALQLLWEELACAIAASQAALFRGELQELETAITVQQEICSKIKSLVETLPAAERNCSVDSAEKAQQENLVFAAAVRRMQRHLDSLRSVLDGPSPSYGADQGRRVI